MIVLVVDVHGIIPVKRERQSPVAAHLYCPLSVPLPFQRVEAQAGEVHVAWLQRNVQAT